MSDSNKHQQILAYLVREENKQFLLCSTFSYHKTKKY